MKTIKGFKAFDKGLTCKGFKFEEGKEYTHEGDIKICESGFHFCENPLDVLNYYDLIDSEFAEVEAIGKVKKNNDNDSKLVTDKIKIGAKLDLPMFIKSSIDFVWEKCNQKGIKKVLNKASSGDYSKLASSGYYSKLASSGYSAQLASSGDSSQLASSGDSAKLASSGDSSQLASSGDYSQLASSGDSSQLASSGDSAKLASSGDSSQLASSGDYSQLASSGNYSVIAGIGINNIAKGIKGNWIVLAEWKYDKKLSRNIPIYVKSQKIDGKKLKENTYYKLKKGKFVEVK
jgi:hypothetical protein